MELSSCHFIDTSPLRPKHNILTSSIARVHTATLTSTLFSVAYLCPVIMYDTNSSHVVLCLPRRIMQILASPLLLATADQSVAGMRLKPRLHDGTGCSTGLSTDCIV